MFVAHNIFQQTYRNLGIVVGGYGLWSGVVPLGGLGLYQLGFQLNDALLIFAMLGPLFYIAILIYGFAAPLRWHPGMTIAITGLTTMLLAALITPAELPL
jgi:hypothetical protein